MKAPSERELQRVERELRKAARGAQKAVGGGIYMRLDSKGARRFQFRVRGGNGSGHAGGTYDSWQDAVDARTRREADERAAADGTIGPSALAIRDWEIKRYVRDAWWPDHVELHLDVLTQLDYERGWNDLKPHVKGITLAQLESSPLVIDQIKRRLVKAKTFPAGHKRAGQLAPAAADKPLKVLSAICAHAVRRQILVRNPLAGVRYFNRRRTSKEDKEAPSHRPILQSEVKLPETAARAGTGMRGDPLTILRRRLIPELIVVGYRPSDIMAMRHRWWRDENGRKPVTHVEAAVKDLAGHLLEGEPKTGARNVYLFDAIAESLEAIYQLDGCPDLDALVFPNANGGLLDWGNWRQGVWYPALLRAGIAKGRLPDSAGAFFPYILRHVGVTIMLHATRPEGGNYSEREVARQYGHTVATLDRVYADIPDDMHGIAGLTMDQILQRGRRQVWGPMPGDPDYDEIEYDLLEAAAITGIDNKALAARIQRGSLPGSKRRNRYYVTRFDLTWHGLIAPSRQSS